MLTKSDNDQQEKVNSVNLSESPELLSRRKNRQSKGRLSKEEIKYQRFVHDLQKDIQFYLKTSLRESHFDPRPKKTSKNSRSYEVLQATLRAQPTLSIPGSHRMNETERIFQSVVNQQNPSSYLRCNEKKRLTADVQTILTAPAMKNFYTQFIR